MPIELKMPALSPTMEEGTLAKWLVKEGDAVKSGDILAEIETDKATMEYEAVDEGTITKIVVPEGADGVKVGAVIATLAEEGEDASALLAAEKPAPASQPEEKGYGANPATDPPPAATDRPATAPAPQQAAPAKANGRGTERIKASPLARRLAASQGIDLAGVAGSGPGGRVVKADLEGVKPSAAPAAAAPQPAAAPSAKPEPAPTPPDSGIPHEAVKLSSMRKTIARRLSESKREVPHIYLTVDVKLDPLLALRGELNRALEPRGIKLSVNDMLIKALALALIEVPACNVSFAGDQLLRYSRADVSVAVSIPNGLITPIIEGAEAKSLSTIATAMKDLAGRAKDGKLQPHEYQGGTASISNMGMLGIKHFAAVINPPQATILAIGAGEKRPWVEGDQLTVATVMTVTGSFDHRAVDGADGAQLMATFKRLVESPLAMLA